MAGRDRRWQAKRHHRPPPPPYHGYDHANNQRPVPLWEKEFISYVSGISWQKFSQNKHFDNMTQQIEDWDDSAAYENFQNMKSRFRSNYHAQPSDIPLPDPDLYIDKVDHERCEIDPELVADLDKARRPPEAPDNKLAIAANDKSQNQSGNWDDYLEKPAEVNKWEGGNSRSNMGWGTALDSWDKANWGWGSALVQPSWDSPGDNHCAANNWSSYQGASNNTYQDQRNAYGRKRNGGGYSQQRNNKSRNQAGVGKMARS